MDSIEGSLGNKAVSCQRQIYEAAHFLGSEESAFGEVWVTYRKEREVHFKDRVMLRGLLCITAVVRLGDRP